MKLIIVLFCIAAAVVGKSRKMEDYENQLREGTVQFTAKMFSEVAKEKPNKSVVMSPFSVLTPLAQLSLASVGDSHDELLHAIGLENDNATRGVFPEVSTQLRSLKGVELKLASKVYIPTGFQLNEQFEADTRQLFDSEVQNIDFKQSESAASEINNWVEEKTNHRIKELVRAESLDESTRALLVNAIYFKGSWKDKFNKDYTMDKDFHVSTDTTIKLPTMYKHGDFKYSYNTELNAQILSLPFEGEEISFIIALPNEIDGLPALADKIKENPNKLIDVVENLSEQTLDIHIPKFKIETEIDLKDILKKVGVTKVFHASTARLDNLLRSSEPLAVSEAVQKAFIEINEEGAEAAAGNEFGIVAVSLPPQFEANRPFLFGLLVKYNSLPIFTGAYYG